MLIGYCIESINCCESCKHKNFHILDENCVAKNDCKLGKNHMCCPDTASFDYHCNGNVFTCRLFS